MKTDVQQFEHLKNFDIFKVKRNSLDTNNTKSEFFNEENAAGSGLGPKLQVANEKLEKREVSYLKTGRGTKQRNSEESLLELPEISRRYKVKHNLKASQKHSHEEQSNEP